MSIPSYTYSVLKPYSRFKSRNRSNSSPPYKSGHKDSQDLALECPTTPSPLLPWSSLSPERTLSNVTLLTGTYQPRSTTTATKRSLPSCLKKPSALSIIHEGYEMPPSFGPPTTACNDSGDDRGIKAKNENKCR
jgi:hypothetical protein